MKKNRKWITAVLTVCMVIGLFAVTASAAEKKLLILGDSVAAAFGLDKYIENAGGPSNIVDGYIIEGSYADLVAKGIGAEALPHAHGGWRAGDFVNVMNGVDYDNLDLVSQKLIAGLGKVMPGDIQKAIDDEQANLPGALADSDYVSVNFGANDIYTYSLTIVAMNHREELLKLGLPDFDNITSFNDLSATISSLLGTAKSALAILNDLETEFDTGLANFEAAFPQMLDYLTINAKPGAKIFVNSVVCPIKLNINISEDIALKIRTKSDTVAAEANKFMKGVIADYENVYFVDTQDAEYFTIKDVDTSVFQGQGIDLKEDTSQFVSFMRLVHPNEKGHAYMAQQILKAIYRAETKPEVTVGYNALGQVQIKWNKVDGAVSYIVYRASEENGKYSVIGATPNTGWTDMFAPADGTYYYKVVAAMDTLGQELTEESDPAAFSTTDQSFVGKSLTQILMGAIDALVYTMTTPLRVAKIVAKIIKVL